MQDNEKKQIGAGFIIGLLVMIAGGLLLLGTLGYSIGFRIEDYWPVLLIVIGLVKILQPRRGRQILWGFVLLLLGVLFQLKNLDIIYFHFHELWPILLIIIGYHIARGSVWRSSRWRHRTIMDGRAEAGAPKQDACFEKAETVDRDVVHVSTTMGGGRYTYLSKKLRGGEVSVVMGGCALDLRQADMEGTEMILEARTVMAGIEIRVPTDWEVIISGSPLMGGIENKTNPSPTPTKRLIIKGSGFMGGIEVKN
jgi:predicted membrane protein